MGFVGDIIRGIGIEPTELPIVGGIFGESPQEEALQQQMRAAGAAYGQMRFPTARARHTALRNALGGVAAPTNQMMGAMYGEPAMMDLQMASQMPISAYDPQGTGILGPGAPPQSGGYVPGSGGPNANPYSTFRSEEDAKALRDAGEQAAQRRQAGIPGQSSGSFNNPQQRAAAGYGGSAQPTPEQIAAAEEQARRQGVS